MEQHRALDLLQVGEELDQKLQIVAVDWAVVVEAQLLEEEAWDKGVLERLSHVVKRLLHSLSNHGNAREDLVNLLLEVLIKRLRANLVEVLGQCAHRYVNRHAVVIEQDQQVSLKVASMVERLKGHACRDGCIANDGHRLRLFSKEVVRGRHPQR